MLKFNIIFSLLFLLFIDSHAEDVCRLAKKLNLSAASKAAVQWERVFSSSRKMKKYNIDSLNDSEKEKLKEYLINHAIDSDKPRVAGE
jgi:hypothetical protein